MTPALWLVIAGWVFAAGGAWFALKQVRRDVNGLGTKVHRLAAEIADARRQSEREADRRYMTLAIILLASAEERDRELLADRLLDGIARKER